MMSTLEVTRAELAFGTFLQESAHTMIEHEVKLACRDCGVDPEVGSPQLTAIAITSGLRVCSLMHQVANDITAASIDVMSDDFRSRYHLTGDLPKPVNGYEEWVER
jgi:hypothetical protein